MSVLAYILIFNFIGSIVSLVGGLLLLIKEKAILKTSHLLASFAAGSLLGAAFFDLLPEAEAEGAGTVDVFFWTLFGFLFFFILERFIHWFHRHGHADEEKGIKPTVPLIVIGDSIHNFIDGIAIASTFLVSIPLGIVTAFAVAAHEIPQEIGDFGLLLHKGLRKNKIILINLASALTSVIGALLAYFLRDSIVGILPVFLSITAGFFIYIASSDLIPEIYHEKRRGFAFYETLLLIIGVVVIWATINALSGFEI